MSKFQLLLVFALSLTMPIVAMAGPAEDASAAVDRWASTFSANDPDELSKVYWTDAILLGTGSPVMFEGNEAILSSFRH